MNILLILTICLGLFAGYLIYQLKLQKHYYEYKAEKMDSLEHELQDEQEQHRLVLKKLNKIAYINPISKIGNLDFFIHESCEQFFPVFRI